MYVKFLHGHSPKSYVFLSYVKSRVSNILPTEIAIEPKIYVPG